MSSEHDKFANVKLPVWYRRLALLLRIVGFIVLVFFAKNVFEQSNLGGLGNAVGFFIGIALLLLPSLPKAYVEQRNRNRGMKDGSFQRYLKEKHPNIPQKESGDL